VVDAADQREPFKRAAELEQAPRTAASRIERDADPPMTGLLRESEDGPHAGEVHELELGEVDRHLPWPPSEERT